MRVIGPNKKYIDYFQGAIASPEVLSKRFGIRVRPEFCSVVAKNGHGDGNDSGKQYHIPLEHEQLPSHVRMIVEDHVLNYPASDLIDVLTGRKSFQEALESPPKSGPLWLTANGTERLPNNSEKSVTHDREAEFLKTELEISLSSANLASLMYKNGNKEAAERTSADAEKCYAVIHRILADPEASSYLTIKGTQELTAKMEELRKTLDDLQSLMKGV